MGGSFEVLVIVIWIVFAILAGAKGKKKNAANNPARVVAKKEVEKPVSPKVSGGSKDYSSDWIRMQKAANTTHEKTHSHEGEVTGNLTIQEDRKNDWLARQIKEESRFIDWL